MIFNAGKEDLPGYQQHKSDCGEDQSPVFHLDEHQLVTRFPMDFLARSLVNNNSRRLVVEVSADKPTKHPCNSERNEFGPEILLKIIGLLERFRGKDIHREENEDTDDNHQPACASPNQDHAFTSWWDSKMTVPNFNRQTSKVRVIIDVLERQTMVSSSRQALACILLLLAVASFTPAQKDQTASISGKVTIKDKPATGIVVTAVETNYSGGWQRPCYRGTTDAEGNYRIDNVPANSYYVYPIAPAFVVNNAQSQQLLTVAPGETIRDIDFSLVRGGVITGKITGADGQPLIEQHVNVAPVDFQTDYRAPNFIGFSTDDRGVYRVFGLRQGKYRVSVGDSGSGLPGNARQIYRKTYYPSVTDPAKAAIVEVTEGGEIRDIDIEMEPPISTFKVTGRVIDGETGKPLSGVQFSVIRTDGSLSVSSTASTGSDNNGEFKIENVTPGHYSIQAAPSDKSEWRAEPLVVDIVDRDITGLEMRTKRAAALFGVVVLQNYDEKSVAPKLDQLQLSVVIEDSATQYHDGRTTRVAPDGSFRLGGLAGGHAQLMFHLENRTGFRDIELVSVEQDGVVLPKVIELKDGEQINGIRVLARYNNFTGAIHGQVKFEDGELPQDSHIMVSVKMLDEKPSRSPYGSAGISPQLDSRGRFMIEALEAGTYEVSAMVFVKGQSRFDVPKQQVTVTNNAVSDLTITVKLKP